MFLSNTNLFANNYPLSIKKWINQAEYFWKMDFSDEAKFKKDLIKYYSDVFAGKLSEKNKNWIQEGHLASDHYSWYFSRLRNTTITKIVKVAHPNSYVLYQTRKYCFTGEYNSPEMNKIVEKYKVKNLIQSDVDEWLKKFRYPFLADEACLIIKEQAILHLTKDKNPLIFKVENKILESELDLSPNKE